MRFVDTNVLLYAVSTAKSESAKTRIALDLLRSSDLALSVQVLQEFYVQATRPSRKDALTHQQACLLIESFRRFPVQDITSSLLEAALHCKDRFQISYWDAAIIEAARNLGCKVVLSEDLNDGQTYHGIRVRNPFA